jgi:hypothetical protein
MTPQKFVCSKLCYVGKAFRFRVQERHGVNCVVIFFAILIRRYAKLVQFSAWNPLVPNILQLSALYYIGV